MKSQDSNVKYSAARTGWGQKSSQNSHPLTLCYAETKADLVELQNSLPGPPGYWDPLDLAESTILAGYGIDTVEANIGWWRHAEIKHGRVAMAAVVGYLAQTGFTKGFLSPFPWNIQGPLIQPFGWTPITQDLPAISFADIAAAGG